MSTTTTEMTKKVEQVKVASGFAKRNANKKRFFWWWVGYQAVKGILTLSLIWIPLLLIWLRSRGAA